MYLTLLNCKLTLGYDGKNTSQCWLDSTIETREKILSEVQSLIRHCLKSRDANTNLLTSKSLWSIERDKCITHNKFIEVKRKWLKAQRSE